MSALDVIDVDTLQHVSSDNLLLGLDEPSPVGHGVQAAPTSGEGKRVVIQAVRPNFTNADPNSVEVRKENLKQRIMAKLISPVTANLNEEVHRMFNAEKGRLKKMVVTGNRQIHVLVRPFF